MGDGPIELNENTIATRDAQFGDGFGPSAVQRFHWEH
jgi:hypothetical protein